MRIGLDIGGTKIFGICLDDSGTIVSSQKVPTPQIYEDLLVAVASIVQALETDVGRKCPIGIGVPGSVSDKTGVVFAVNLPLKGQPFRDDLASLLARPVALANDANCTALADACLGVGQGDECVFGLILGTGVGGGYIRHRKIVQGANGLCGEVGHLPLPFRQPEDGPVGRCACGQDGCVEWSICAAGLERLAHAMSGIAMTSYDIVEGAQKGDAQPLAILDRYYEIVAKAMIVPIYALDPDVIAVSGGLNGLPGLYEEVPKRWEKYSFSKPLRTRFVRAHFGYESGAIGAACLTDCLTEWESILTTN